jgi:AP-4 complex subunit beta-1
MSNNTPNATPSSNRPASGFFVDGKKGEINELKGLLKNLNIERDMIRKRDVLKKVIAYMTLGIDVSRLFTEMIMAIETKDVVVKKMVYLYLSTQAHKEPEMAIMCINSLRRECENEDPMVRGLALRSLCNLRMPSILEYVEDPLNKGLSDLSSYVRRVAVMGILKVNQISPEHIENNGWRTRLMDMLQDVDAAVVGNVLFVLNEMMLDQGGMLVSPISVMSLLTRIAEFNEWGLIAVLDYVARYKPTAEDEMFAIMNLLDPVLRSANSGAVLGTIKCFMNLTSNFPDLQPQVWVRAKPPLLTFITGGTPESQYAVLKHLQLILPHKSAQGVFDDEYRQLFVRYNEPPHVKHLKVDLLPLLANEENATELAAELAEYVVDVDAELARRAIQSMGHIAIRIRAMQHNIAEQLMGFIDMDMPCVSAAVVIQLCSLARTYPDVAESIIPHLPRCLKMADDDKARSVVVWMLGEYSALCPEAPYLLENMIDDFEEELSVIVKLQLLTATTKAFFARPPEVQSMLGRLLKAALNDVTDQDTHDRALLYYRLLRSNVDVAKEVLGRPSEAEACDFIDMRNDPRRESLMAEFNTLAVVHEMPSSHFIAEPYRLRLDRAPIDDDTFSPVAATGSAATYKHTTTDANSADLLGDFGDLSEPSSYSQPISLQAGAIIAAPDFQQRWGSLQASFQGTVGNAIPNNVAQMTAAAAARNITAIASGALPNGAGYKMFLFARSQDMSLLGDGGGDHDYFVQLAVTGGTATAMIKTTNQEGDAGDKFASILKEIII